ncbi:MAG TPA: hypothetical protein VHV80_02010 [Steroidobacteraceae bacterium]|jgi:hypothetical protein|nr:hypothetical protein [Steroidobacteraceae bacterium]
MEKDSRVYVDHMLEAIANIQADTLGPLKDALARMRALISP